MDRTRVEAEKHLGFVHVGIFLRSRLLLVDHRTKLDQIPKKVAEQCKTPPARLITPPPSACPQTQYAAHVLLLCKHQT